MPPATAPAVTTSYIEEANTVSTLSLPSNATMNAVAAILPSSSLQPFVLGDGDSNTSGSTDNMSGLGLVSVPHLMWKAMVWNTNDEQVPVNCLLDDGAHLTLIRPECVIDLGLPI